MRLVFGILLTLTLFGCSQLNLERQVTPLVIFVWGTLLFMVKTSPKAPFPARQQMMK